MITVNGVVLERNDITSNWVYVNPILPQGQLGWEYANDGITPVGVKQGDGVSDWDSLPYWFNGVNVKLHYSSGTSLPITITATQTLIALTAFGRFPKARVILNAGINNLNQELTGFTTGTIELVSGTPNSIIVDDGSGTLAYDIIIEISKE